METVLLCFLFGFFLGRILGPILGYYCDSLIMWYKDKYGKYTPGNGKNYLQIFSNHTEVQT